MPLRRFVFYDQLLVTERDFPGAEVRCFDRRVKSTRKGAPHEEISDAATLIFAFTGPALADEVFVMLDMTTKKCVTMRTQPKDMKKYKMLGKYPNWARPRARCTP